MCTNLMLPFRDKDPVIVSGRNVDFTTFVDAKLRKYPRNQEHQSISPANIPQIGKLGKLELKKTGLKWTNKYGYITARIKYTSQIKNRIDIHGMNEKGLTVGMLFCGGSRFLSQSDIKEADYDKCLMVADVVAYLLGTSATIEDVKNELTNNAIVWNPVIKFVPELGYHFAIYDKNGNGLVVEYKMTKQLLYKNVNNIVANEPFYEWQTTNLNYYYNALISRNSKTDTTVADFVEDDGLLVPQPTSSTDSTPEFIEVFGSGMAGLPGNSSSAARFVRGAKLSEYVPSDAFTDRPGAEVPYARQMVQRTMQVMDNVTVVEGESLGLDIKYLGKTVPGECDFTQLTFVTDHTNNILYYCYDMNHNYQEILFNELNWEKEAQTFVRDDRVYNNSTSKLMD